MYPGLPPTCPTTHSQKSGLTLHLVKIFQSSVKMSLSLRSPPSSASLFLQASRFHCWNSQFNPKNSLSATESSELCLRGPHLGPYCALSPQHRARCTADPPKDVNHLEHGLCGMLLADLPRTQKWTHSRGIAHLWDELLMRDCLWTHSITHAWPFDG